MRPATGWQSLEFPVKHGHFTLSEKSYARASNRLLLSHLFLRAAWTGTLPAVLIFLVFLVELTGCASNAGDSATRVGSNTGSSNLFDPGEEVFRDGSSSGGASGVSAEPSTVSPAQEEWSIAVITVSGADHRAIAESARKEISEQFEELDGLYVDGVKGGSAVFYGRFESTSDPEFREAMEQLRAVKLDDGRRAFRRLLPARPLSAKPVEFDAIDLRSLRLQLGSRHPVYSLQVAQWGTFGDEEASYTAYRERAEKHARMLRSQGVTAWFSHNSGKRLSSVNVGVFGADAYDPRSTLFAPEVELLMGQFPQLLVNGEPLLDPRTSKARKPFLVEVPR